MTLLVDSGGTKTEWRDATTGISVVTDGLNPSILDHNTLVDRCSNVVSVFNDVESVYFYGSGCGNVEARQLMCRVLQECFPSASIHVETDMLGACRALSAHEEAMVGILGTGSNACFYDGNRIVDAVPSLGYILGDYGSANHVGKQLLRDFFSQRMPQEVASSFVSTYPVEYGQVIDHVYHRSMANRYLASFAPFATSNVSQPYCRDIIIGSLDLWYETQLRPLCAYSQLLHVVGGYAYAIQDILPLFCAKHGLHLGRVEKTPMDGLVRYHLSRKQ